MPVSALQELKQMRTRLAEEPEDGVLLNRCIKLTLRTSQLKTRNQALKLIYKGAIPENLPDIDAQYEGNLSRLTKYGVVETPEKSDEMPYIIGIDSQHYPMPTFESILRKLTNEDKRVIETIDEPKLLISPFGMSLDAYINGVTNQRGELPQQIQAYRSFNLNNDRSGNLKYFVDQFKDLSGGFTKAQILQQTGQKNPFSGWQVLVIDGKSEIDGQTINKGKNAYGNDAYKGAIDFHEEYQEKGYDGLTPEDIITLYMIAMETGMPFDRDNYCWLLGCFLKSARAVPLSGWSSYDACVDFFAYSPEDGWRTHGSRAARRVGLDR